MKARALAGVLLALAVAPVARPASVAPAEVRALAHAAARDPRALARLRAIDVVGGRPMPIGAALAGAAGGDLKARLRALAASGAVAVPPRFDAQRQARSVLSGRRYRGSPVPRPLHGAFAWTGRELGRLFRWLGRELAKPFRWVGLPAPRVGTGLGLGSLLGDLIVLALVVGVGFAVARIGRRSGGVHVSSSGETGLFGRRTDDPAELERSAEEAELAGDLSAAVRLRFRAGLERLARARVIPARSSVTTREVRRAVASADFDELARAFDEVVYGRRAADRDDVAQARAGWPRVLEEARSR